MAVHGISEAQLARRGIASVTIKEALIPILEAEIEKLLNAMEKCPAELQNFLDIRGDLRAVRNIQRQLDASIRSYEMSRPNDSDHI
jgi:hypothetical protein